MQKSAERLNQKCLEILEGNLVLLHYHPEGQNKIQDQYKNKEFVVVGKHPEPHVTALSQSIAVTLCRQSIDASSKILGQPRMMEDLESTRQS